MTTSNSIFRAALRSRRSKIFQQSLLNTMMLPIARPEACSLRLILNSSTTRSGLLLAWLYLGLHDVKHQQARAKELGCFQL
jgi:hypothetical protein